MAGTVYPMSSASLSRLLAVVVVVIETAADICHHLHLVPVSVRGLFSPTQSLLVRLRLKIIFLCRDLRHAVSHLSELLF